MEAKTIKVPVGKVISSTDRKHGGEGNIETLAQSIKEHGLIHPPAVKEAPGKEGQYRVIAGRRRFEAVKSLGWKNIDVTVYPGSADDEAIALAENVNREDMHPLDEAETFKRQMDAGKPVEEIAKYYSRSVSGIYQRVRLCALIDDVKTMFRDGKINLSGAALIASLPESDQEKFFKKYGSSNVEKYDLVNFIRSVQKQSIKYFSVLYCGKCKKRTFNTTPGLFEDYSTLEDVCFDPDCYAEKWQMLIGHHIAGQSGETENNIIINRGIPEFLPKKSKSMAIGEKEYALLPVSGYAWKETNKKGKAKTAWLVSLDCRMSSGADAVKVTRVSHEKYDRPTTHNGYSSYRPDTVKDFMVDQIPELDEEDRKVVAKQMKEKYHSKWGFRYSIKESVLKKIVDIRINEGSGHNLAALYLTNKFSTEDENGNWIEIDPDYKDIVTALLGNISSFSEIPQESFLQKIFLLIIALGIRTDELPDIDDDNDWARAEDTLFWKFAQISKEEYIKMYNEFACEIIKSHFSFVAETKAQRRGR